MGREAMLLLVPVAAVCFGVQAAATRLLARRAPRVAQAVERWAPWEPLLVVVVAIGFVHPALGVATAVLCWVLLTSWRALGSPFRPRR